MQTKTKNYIPMVLMIDSIRENDIVQIKGRKKDWNVTALGKTHLLAEDENGDEHSVLYSSIYKYNGQIVWENRQYKK